MIKKQTLEYVDWEDLEKYLVEESGLSCNSDIFYNLLDEMYYQVNLGYLDEVSDCVNEMIEDGNNEALKLKEPLQKLYEANPHGLYVYYNW